MAESAAAAAAARGIGAGLEPWGGEELRRGVRALLRPQRWGWVVFKVVL
jgi:hypothetical protein